MTLPEPDKVFCLGMPIIEALKDWMMEIIQAARGTK